jgi:ATP-dependent 26S proteasome regulatory subunit
MTKSNHQNSIHKTLQEIDVLIRARYPILYLLTHEEARLESLLHDLLNKQSKSMFLWTATRGLQEYGNPKNASDTVRLNDPSEILAHIRTTDTEGVFVLKDFHPFLEDPLIVRLLRDVAHELKSHYKNILIMSPQLNLPIELEKDITLIDIPLPDFSELGELFVSVCKVVAEKNRSSVKLNNEHAKSIVRAAQGLTLVEAENVFAKSAVDDSVINKDDVSLILKEKQQIIRKSGILEFYPADLTLSDIGGLANLKHWLNVRGSALTPQAEKYGLQPPKGVLLLGAPGCGKSLTAKAVSNAWQLPLLRLDFGRIFSGLVGSSEENMRRALKVAESIAPAVLWIDEIEKGLAGGAGGQSDGGTSGRVFGTFLTWMQEKTANVFVVATANRIDLLPPELLRRGRFDEIFFMDLPSAEVKDEILRIHIKKRSRSPESFNIRQITDVMNGFSGAEIEHCVVEALFMAFYENRDLTTEDVIKAARETIPLSVTYTEELKRLRDWAKNRARPADISPPKAAYESRATRLEI